MSTFLIDKDNTRYHSSIHVGVEVSESHDSPTSFFDCLGRRYFLCKSSLDDFAIKSTDGLTPRDVGERSFIGNLSFEDKNILCTLMSVESNTVNTGDSSNLFV